MEKVMKKAKEKLDEIYDAIKFVDRNPSAAFDLDKIADSVICIDEALEQAEQNEKMLDIFKNSLTIEHHEYPTIEHNDSEDVMSYLVKELYTIRQNELDKDMRKALREWVLKNAFPKELKALEIIKEKRVNVRIFDNISKNTSYYFYLKHHNNLWYGMSSDELNEEDFNLLKEVLL